MLHKPDKNELKAINNLNKAYDLINKGLKLIKENAPKDNDVSLRVYRIGKELEKINSKIIKLLESKYVDTEFNKIITVSKKKKGKRLDRKANKGKKK